jgi:hypothetical protein
MSYIHIYILIFFVPKIKTELPNWWVFSIDNNYPNLYLISVINVWRCLVVIEVLKSIRTRVKYRFLLVHQYRQTKVDFDPTKIKKITANKIMF